MIPWRRPWLWLILALAVILIAVAVLWLPGVFPSGSNLSHLPADRLALETGASPLHTPTPLATSADVPPSWIGAGAALFWAALGLLLALGFAFLVVQRYRRVE
jgi:hypothetical protein